MAHPHREVSTHQEAAEVAARHPNPHRHPEPEAVAEEAVQVAGRSQERRDGGVDALDGNNKRCPSAGAERLVTSHAVPVGPLQVIIGDHEIELPPDREVEMGRAEECDVRLSDMRVSRHHARLRCTETGWILEDRDSTGGTWLGGERVEHLPLTGPVDVRLGDPTGGPVVRLLPLAADGGLAATAGPGDVLRPVAPAQRRPSGIFASAHVPKPRTRFGRAPDNDVVLDDLLVSRHHAELQMRADGRLEVLDLGSRNGTYVNGRRVERAVLDERDLLAVGRSTFRATAGGIEEFRDTGAVTFEASGIVVRSATGEALVDDVGFSLAERSLFAVVGPSGSGKSTLLRSLAGLRPADEGRVLYDGRDLYREYEELRHRIGIVPQDDVLHRELTVRRALEYAGRLRFPADVAAAERTGRILEVLDELGLSHRLDAVVDTLSGGERKRTSVALELLTKPSLLFLDEPAAGLDPGLTRVLMGLLRELADHGHTVVVVTHELVNVRLCDQVLVLAPGGVPAYVGPPQTVAAHFDAEDLTDVFGALASQPDRDWRFRTERAGAGDSTDPGWASAASAASAAPSAPPGAPAPPAPPAPPGARLEPDGGPPASAEPAPVSPVRQQGWWSQFATLSARNLAVLGADRRNLALLALQAPVLGVLMLAALPAGELGLPPASEVRFVSTAGLVLFVLLLGATWLGANNAIREVARELPIYRRERAVGLSPSAYVASKAAVLGALTVVQSALLVALATARQRGPEEAVVLGWPLGELMAVVALAGVASMALGLLVSALSGSAERATSVLPILLIFQLVLSAGSVLPEIVDKPVLREMSTVSSAQWGVAAAASTVDLNELQLFDERLRDLRTVDAADPLPALETLTREPEPEQRWAHTASAWWTAVSALALLTVVPLAATVVVLRRDPAG